MRSALALLLVVVVLLLLPTALPGAAPSSGAPPPSAPVTTPIAAAAPPLPLPDVTGSLAPFELRNTTYVPAAAHPSAAGPPISALSVTPPVRRPATTPTVVTYLSSSLNCCVSANFTTPSGGPWAAVVLNYTGSAVGGVYDSSFRAYVDQVQVLFGTTPEYGVWYVEQDLTPYESLFNGTYNFTFLLSAATVGGHFVTSVSIEFYPLAPGASPPMEPDLILPIFHRVFVSTTTLTVSASVSVPDDVRNATLEMWSYGFGPDEFWFAGQQTYRSVGVSSDGQGLVDVLPFPFVNTGGSDLFAWRPITAAFTLNDRPYEYDVTGALGLLEGNHTLTANVSGVSSGSNWLIGGALLLYTDPTVGPATLQSYRYSQPAPHWATDHSTYYDEFANASYAYSSSFSTAQGIAQSATFTNESFVLANQVSGGGSWDNLSGRESLATTVRSSDPGGTGLVSRSVDFRVGMDLGQSLVISSTTGGGYPMFGNFTTYFLNADQEWLEDQVSSFQPPSGPIRVQVVSVHNHVAGGTNVYSGAEELTGPNAALLLAITFIQSSTSDDFYEGVSDGTLSFGFHHFLSGSAYNPPGPYNAETVLVDSTTSPLSTALSATPAPVEIGQSLRLSVAYVGGLAPVTLYTYSGLPPGCLSTNGPVLLCSPTTAGTYAVSVQLVDALGNPGTPSVQTVEVIGGPTASVLSNQTAVDLGQPAYAYAGVTGGIGPYVCLWSTDGTPSPAVPCDQAFSSVASVLGTTNLSVVVTDSTGGRSMPAYVVLAVVAAPWLTIAPSQNLTLHPGGAALLTASVLGGVPPLRFVWYVNGTADPSSSGATFAFLANQTGVYEVSATVIDGTNVTGFRVGPSITVASAVTPGPPAEPSGTTVPVLWASIAVVGTIAGALVGTFLGYRWGYRRLRPSSPRPPMPRRP